MEFRPQIQKSKLQLHTKWKAQLVLVFLAGDFVSSRNAPWGGALRDDQKMAARETTPVWKYNEEDFIQMVT